MNLEYKYRYNLRYRIRNIFKNQKIITGHFQYLMQLNGHEHLFKIKNFNLGFYIKYYEKYPEFRYYVYHHNQYIFQNILKFYYIIDFYGSSLLNFIVLKLNRQDRNQNPDLPDNFIYCYNGDLEDILNNFSGSNESSLIHLITSIAKLNTSTSYFVSDIVLKMFLTSVSLRNFISSRIFIFKIRINSKNLMRLIKTGGITLDDFDRIANFIHYDIDDFDCFIGDSDFLAVETLTGKTITNLVIIAYDMRMIFKTFYRIRKALHYLLKTDKESLKSINDIFLDLFKKENYLLKTEIESLNLITPTLIEH